MDLAKFFGPFPGLKIGATLAVFGVGGWFLFQSDSVSWDEIARAAMQFDGWTLVQVLSCILFQIGLMVFRVWFLVPRTYPFAGVMRAVAFGHALNALVPAKLGEALKAVLLGRMDSRGSLGVGIGVMVADRIVDIGALTLLIVTSGVLALPKMAGGLTWNWPVLLGGALGGGLLLWGVLQVGLRRSPRVRALVDSLWLGLKGMGSPWRGAAALAVGWGAWAVEVIAIQWLAGTLGYSLSFAEGTFVLVALNLAILIPVSMGNVGTFEASVAFALATFGVATESALVIAGTLHLVHFTGIGIWAFVGWSTLQFKTGFSKQLGEELETAASEEARLRALREELRESEAFRLVWEALEIGQEDRFLDVSCGHGLFSVEAKASGAYVYSCDAKSSQVLSLVGIVDETEVATPEHLMVEGDFSRVLLNPSEAGWDDPVAALSQACRRVSPRGKLVVHGDPASWAEPTLTAVAEEWGLKVIREQTLGPRHRVWVLQR